MIRNRHLQAIILFVAAALILPALVIAGQYPVVHVVDGDTIDVIFDGQKERVRLLCVNTPESVHPDRKQNIPMGKVASDYAKSRLSGKSVYLEFEGGRRRGNYGRLLAYVILNGQNFNLELVRQGFPLLHEIWTEPKIRFGFPISRKTGTKRRTEHLG